MVTKIKVLLDQKGISQSSLARLCGIDVYRLNRYVTGAARPGLKSLQRIATALGVSIHEISEVGHE